MVLTLYQALIVWDKNMDKRVLRNYWSFIVVTVFHFLSNLNQFDGGLLTIFRLLAARTQKEKCGNTSVVFDSYICVCRHKTGSTSVGVST